MKQALLGLNVVDIVFVIFITAGLLIGVRKGLAATFSKLLALVVAILCTLHFYSPAAKWVSGNSFMPTRTTEVILYVLIFVVAWGVINLLLKIINKFMEIKYSDGVSRLGGFLLGAIWFYVFAGFVLYSLLVFQFPYIKTEWVSDSMLAPVTIQIPIIVYSFVFQITPPVPTY